MKDRMMRAEGGGRAFFGEPTDFHTDEIRGKATSIVIKGDTVIPEGVIESWDISEKQNGSVIAYIEDDGTDSATYKLTIGGEGKIIVNTNMHNYFQLFTSCTTMDLTYLDTSLTTNMNRMFMFSSNLTTLDLSNFNTSNVTDMSMMFYGLSSLIELNLNNFETLNVTTMDSMFNNCYSLTELDLRSFDTTSVTNYSGMFNNTNTSNLSSILVTRDTWTIPNTVITNAVATDFTYV